MKILIVSNDGRLGNQLFQYAFLKSIFPSERILVVSTNFKDLLAHFEVPDFFLLAHSRWLKAAMRRLLFPLAAVLTKTPLMGSLKMKMRDIRGHSSEALSHEIRRGLLPIYYVSDFFAQSHLYWPDWYRPPVNIKRCYVEQAEHWLRKSFAPGSPVVAVHLRLGDYKNFEVLGLKDQSLPLNYFKESIEKIRALDPKVGILLLSDEPEKAEALFLDMGDAVRVSKNPMGVDLALITLCPYQILSPSSYSWWGSYLSPEKKMIYVPKFWLGWKAGVEFQQGGTPPWATPIEIQE